MENTYVYSVLPPPKPLINPAVCVVGRPKSGKTMLSKRVAKQFDLVYLTVPIIVQSILDAQEKTQLYEDVSMNLDF